MHNAPNIKVIIPAYNEEGSIALVVKALPKQLCNEIIVTDNNSNDNTTNAAKLAGATVLFEKKPGYGAACLKAIDYVRQTGGCDIVVFIDGDFSDHPEEMEKIIAPIIAGDADMVIGSRIKALRERGSMTPQQVFGNWLAVTLIKLFMGRQYTDLGPFRAITWNALEKINMIDTNYGWTVEMQVKAIKHKLRYKEVPVRYRNRAAGYSKVSGSIKGSILAGYKIIKTIFKYI
ncbi:MAG: glycosyltransferase family 2 protein [Sediminibacterium sp.]|jgi:glycosyltransferase involved in cell wall biosynthesis|nr:glycosyltransferase [Chitinophagaceae bacterium]MCA6446285.1 glycosyltransferase [Chitinophagaceae bacterium]GHV06589.1 glycosyl hydrolase [Bacteroidia bacterium]